MAPVLNNVCRRTQVLVLALIGAAACSSTEEPSIAKNPLAGYSVQGIVDSIGRPAPQSATSQGEGTAHGTVIAASAPGAGNDSLAKAIRIPGVVIRIYAIVGDPNAANPTIGSAVASTTTDANGHFKTPAIDGSQGWHVLTFTPPAGSGYQAIWVRTRFSTQSELFPWWVTLRK